MCCENKKIFLELTKEDIHDEEYITELIQNVQTIFDWTHIQAETVITLAIARGKKKILVKESSITELKSLTPMLVEAGIPFTVEDSNDASK